MDESRLRPAGVKGKHVLLGKIRGLVWATGGSVRGGRRVVMEWRLGWDGRKRRGVNELVGIEGVRDGQHMCRKKISPDGGCGDVGDGGKGCRLGDQGRFAKLTTRPEARSGQQAED